MYLHRIVVAQCWDGVLDRIVFYYFKGYGSTNVHKCIMKEGMITSRSGICKFISCYKETLEASEDVLVVVGHLKSHLPPSLCVLECEITKCGNNFPPHGRSI